ncbi:MAG: hypothetical protein U0W24_00190 [Bacteroidales bacterium]
MNLPKELNIFILVILILVCCNKINQTSSNNNLPANEDSLKLLANINMNDDVRSFYSDSLEKLVNCLIIKSKISESLLLICIPQSETETAIFCDLDYSKNLVKREAFNSINQYWMEKCIQKKDSFFKSYAEYSLWVDGYFAEDYFISLDYILKKIGSDAFCNLVSKCDSAKINRIKIHFKENGSINCLYK